jgi:hypothetical protein
MARTFALGFLAIAAPMILLCLFVGSALGEVVFAVLVTAFPIALIALGASRGGHLGPLGWPLLGLLLLLEGAVVAMLALRGTVPTAPWLGGLPLATAVQVYGLFLAPLFYVSLLYAFTFDRFSLRSEDLEELRRRVAKKEEN